MHILAAIPNSLPDGTKGKMRRQWSPQISIPASVQPIPPHLAKLVHGPSSSTAPDVAYATADICDRLGRGELSDDDDGADDNDLSGESVDGRGRMAAVSWPKERRIDRHVKGKGRAREDALVILVKQLPQEVSPFVHSSGRAYSPEGTIIWEEAHGSG